MLHSMHIVHSVDSMQGSRGWVAIPNKAGRYCLKHKLGGLTLALVHHNLCFLDSYGVLELLW
jgi:hypothetical protein